MAKEVGSFPVLSMWSFVQSSVNKCGMGMSELVDYNRTLEEIEKKIGEPWSRIALACITFSKAGLSDSEMQDVLSLDDQVLNHVFQHSTQDKVRRFPMHSWLKLKGSVKRLLVERKYGCLQWRHQQLREAAEQRYAGFEETLAHELMGRYFGDLTGTVGEARLVARQPLNLNGEMTKVWFPEARVNVRRCEEAPYHMVRGGVAMQEQACQELCSIHVVYACVKVGVGFDLLRSLIELDKAMEGRDRRVTHYMRWLLRDITTMVQNDPQISVPASCSNQPLHSHPRRDYEYFMRETSSNDAPKWRCYSVIEKEDRYGACLSILRGHRNYVTSAAWSPDASKLASCSWDSTIRIYDTMTGECLFTIEKPFSTMMSMAWSPDSSKIATALMCDELCIWDVVTRKCLYTLRGHENTVKSVSWSPDSTKIVSGSNDSTVRMWDAVTGKCLKIMQEDTNGVDSVVWSPNASKIVSIFHDGTMSMWDAITFARLRILLGDNKLVSSMAWSPDSTKIVCGSWDNLILVYYKDTRLQYGQ